MLSTNASDVAAGLIGDIEAFADEVEEEKERALEEAQRLAKQRVPVDTGYLRSRIEIRGDSVVADTDYAVYVNYGSEHNTATLFLTDSALDAFRNSIERLERR